MTKLLSDLVWSAVALGGTGALAAIAFERAEPHDDGRDFAPTNKCVLRGHHFAAVAGPGPLVGPTVTAQFGYLPGTLWLIAGAVLGGCLQDFVILFCSIRRDGESLGQMARQEVSKRGGYCSGFRASDYEDYLRRTSGEPTVLSREEFYLETLSRKCARVSSRCC